MTSLEYGQSLAPLCYHLPGEKKGFKPQNIHVATVATLENDTSDLSTVQTRAEFRNRRERLIDNQRPACPTTNTTDENTDHIHHMVMDER